MLLAFRHLDTASFYENEADVGRAVLESGIPREEIHITSKAWPLEAGVWVEDGFSAVLEAVRKSVGLLGTYADLYLIHAPFNPSQRISYWLALEEAQRLGLVRSIGVSNYGVKHLRELLDSPLTHVVPAANEVELHPFLRKDEIDHFCSERGIRIIAYSPLARAQRLDHPTLLKVAKRHDVSAAQILIRWSMQHRYVPIPKSVKVDRIKENVNGKHAHDSITTRHIRLCSHLKYLTREQSSILSSPRRTWQRWTHLMSSSSPNGRNGEVSTLRSSHDSKKCNLLLQGMDGSSQPSTTLA